MEEQETGKQLGKQGDNFEGETVFIDRLSFGLR